jgi:hypothetical protein
MGWDDDAFVLVARTIPAATAAAATIAALSSCTWKNREKGEKGSAESPEWGAGIEPVLDAATSVTAGTSGLESVDWLSVGGGATNVDSGSGSLSAAAAAPIAASFLFVAAAFRPVIDSFVDADVAIAGIVEAAVDEDATIERRSTPSSVLCGE